MKQGETVLWVDDNESDVFLFKRAVQAAEVNFDVHVAHNGLEAINYLKQACESDDPDAFPFPKFILTDNRMPVMTGREFLAWLKEHPRCRVIPTVVLGGSASPNELREAYDLGAHSYFVKPMDPAQMLQLVKMIFNYWANACVPPKPDKD